MSLPLFLDTALPAHTLAGSAVCLDGAEARHALKSMRIQQGEQILLSNGAGTLATCKVTRITATTLELTVVDITHTDPPSPQLILVQAIAKNDRSERAVELATECGVHQIYPWQASRSISKWGDATKASKGQAKWKNSAIAATKQSRREFTPTIHPMLSSAQLTSAISEWTRTGAWVGVLHEDASEPLTSHTHVQAYTSCSAIVFIVGPEGGLSTEEIHACEAAGAHTVKLGPEVVRTSTAAAVAFTAFSVVTGAWTTPRTLGESHP